MSARITRREISACMFDATVAAEARYESAAEALWLVILAQEMRAAGIDSPTCHSAAQAARIGLASSLWGAP